MKNRIPFSRIFIFYGILLSQAHLAFASNSTSEIQEAIENTLAERHPHDTPDWWKNLGPTAVPVIEKMILDSDNTYHRTRLLSGLGNFSTPDVREFLRQQTLTSNEEILKSSAIQALGISGGDSELEFISRFLKDNDVHVRESAAIAIKRFKSPAADRVLSDFKNQEKTPWLIAKLDGKPIPLPTQLPIVSSSEDRLYSDWNGEWEGHWMRPDTNSAKILTSPVRLKISRPEDSTQNQVLPQLSIHIKSEKLLAFELQTQVGKADRIEGNLRPLSKESTAFLGSPSPYPLIFKLHRPNSSKNVRIATAFSPIHEGVWMVSKISPLTEKKSQ